MFSPLFKLLLSSYRAFVCLDGIMALDGNLGEGKDRSATQAHSRIEIYVGFIFEPDAHLGANQRVDIKNSSLGIKVADFEKFYHLIFIEPVGTSDSRIDIAVTSYRQLVTHDKTYPPQKLCYISVECGV